MLKKICIGIFLAVLCILGIYNGYLYIKEQHKPNITVVDKDSRYYINDRFNPSDYVLTITDYKQNTLKKSVCLKSKVVETANNFTIIKYTVDDGNKNIKSKKLKLYRIDEGIDTTIDIDINSTVTKKDKAKSKSFKIYEKDLDIKTQFFKADNYGATSLCSYKIKPIKNRMNIIIGYKCIIK